MKLKLGLTRQRFKHGKVTKTAMRSVRRIFSRSRLITNTPKDARVSRGGRLPTNQRPQSNALLVSIELVQADRKDPRGLAP